MQPKNKWSIKVDHAKKIQMVEMQLKGAQAVAGTPAARYLQSRGITFSCDDLRFKEVMVKREGIWHKTPALLAIIRNTDGKIQGLQTTYLTPDGQKDPHAEVAKRTSGLLKEGSVLIQKDASNRIILAEGVETALSLKQAGVQGEIRAVLGINNFKTQKGLEGKEIILAADNDTHKTNPHLQKTLHEAATKLGASLVMPGTPGHDFNDVLKEKGASSILHAFGQEALDPHEALARHLSQIKTTDAFQKQLALADHLKIDHASQTLHDLKADVPLQSICARLQKDCAPVLEATITHNRALLQEGKPVQVGNQLLASERKYLSALTKDQTLSNTLSNPFKEELKQDLKALHQTYQQERMERSEGMSLRM